MSSPFSPAKAAMAIRYSPASSATLPPLVKAVTSCLRSLDPHPSNFSRINTAPLSQFSQYLDTKLVTEVIDSVHSNPYHALFFFNWASNPSPNPNNFSHNHLSYIAIADLLLSRSLFSDTESLLQNSNQFTDLVVSKLITAHGSRGNVKATLFWYNKVKEVEKGKCLFSYNAVLSVLAKYNKMKVAMSIFDSLVSGNAVSPEVSTYTVMIRGFCKMGMIGDARKLFDEMLCEPNVLTFNTLISGYCKKGDMDEARFLFRRMMKKPDCLPDVVTFTTLIDGYCKKGEFDETMKLLGDMGMSGCRPNVVTYNAIIYGLCMRGNVDDAKMLMTKMRLSGLKENDATHFSILKGLFIAEKLDEASDYFKEMKRRGIKLDDKGYGVAVSAYCKMRQPEKAICLLQEMHNGGIHPNVSCFNSVLRILVEIGEIDRAVSILKSMRGMNCKPNFVSYNTVICSLCNTEGRMREVQQLFDNMVRDRIETSTALNSCMIEGYCRDGNDEFAVQVFYNTISQNYVVSLESFSLLVKLLSGKGKLEVAEKLFDDMCSRCSVADVASYRMVLDRQLLAHFGKAEEESL